MTLVKEIRATVCRLRVVVLTGALRHICDNHCAGNDDEDGL